MKSKPVTHIKDLLHDPKNARKHTPRNVGTIVSALQEVGAARSIVIDEDGVVLAGNATMDAAAEAGITAVKVVEANGNELVAVRRTGLTPEQKTRLALYDNRAAELAEWDTDVLRQLAMDNQLDGLFNAEELAELVGDLAEAEMMGDPDEVPEPPVNPITQPGDLWLLGEHRLLCGDSTKAADVQRLMAGAKADVIWTDPPYGVNHIGGTKDPRRKTHRSGGVVHNDDKTGQDLVAMVSAAIGSIPKHDSTVLYVASPAGANVREMIDAFNGSGFAFRHSLVWVKHAFVFGRADYHYKHELILYGWGERHEWSGERDISTVFEFPRGDKTVDHPTSKPVGLVAGTAKNHPASVMADPFLGSGTTLIAAEQLGRKCYGMEISPQYCDVIVKRWEQLTGKTATRETVQT